ncbi:MAG: cyclase family protein [Actinobacteria bacterium]|nr:cyclase family protein [Actinomycetota bacterium]
MSGRGGVGPSDEEIIEIFERVDNAGRWGPDDELGTLNHITDRKRVQASRLVVEGTVLSLSRVVAADDSPTGRVEMDHRMMVNPAADPSGTPPAASDLFSIESHQQGVTHVDALAHIGSHEGLAYGGRPFGEAVAEDGVAFGSVYAQRHGIYSRGVLLDVAAAREVQWLQPGTEITPDDLEAAERHAGVTVTTGDVVVVRAGVEAYEAANEPHPLLAGPGPAAAEWMHEREVAVYTGDAPDHVTTLGAVILGRLDPSVLEEEEEVPRTRFPVPFHQVAIPAMGLCLLDHCRVEELSETCARLGRFEFLFVAVPLALPGATGSPVNPLALF